MSAPMCSTEIEFQSTHPVRGATCGVTGEVCRDVFQSTHPVRGATNLTENYTATQKFQSTHPVRGAT